MKRHGSLFCLLAACVLAFAFPTQAAAANPILVITSSSNPYTTFLPEILHTEGFNEFDTADISAVTSASISPYDLVVLGDTPLTAAQAAIFTTWVNGGGNLIAMHPDPQLSGLLGLVDTGTTLSNAYLLINTTAGPGVGLVGQTIQFHGPAELYTLSNAVSFADLYSNASTPSNHPAVTANPAGLGIAVAFTYDLARSVAYTRQGNPAWNGQARDAANVPPIRAYNLFYGASALDPQPDWVDFSKIEIPQADEQQRLLANVILEMNSTKKPLPRFWYLPSGYKAAVVMTGDDHGSYFSGSATANRFSDFVKASPSGCSVANWACVRATAYLFPSIIATNTLTNSQITTYVSEGFEVAAHVDSAIDCQDWTTTDLDTDYTNYLASFASEYPGAPAPQTHRMHCVSWSDYDSQPTIELKHGIRFDTTYYYWPQGWINDRPGLFTGSGMPMRYTDRNGNLINVYQANTQMTDESGQTYPLHINTLLDNALSGSGYYGVFTVNMHNDGAFYPGAAPTIVASAQARKIPIVSSLQMLQWLDGRNGSSFTSVALSSNVLSFTVTVGANANNLRAMLPANFGSLGLTSIVQGTNTSVSYQLQTIKGIQYAVFAVSAASYKATYGGAPLFSISGAISPAGSASGTTITATGPVTATATPDSYGNYTLSGVPSGTYTITPSKGAAGFLPFNQVVTVAGANVAAVNFELIQNCPCSLWSNTTVPTITAVADPNPIEVGVRFRSDVAGNITALKFYKGATNTGTHIGNLWGNDGTLLATATFTGETASGWQQVNLSTPVAIAANTTYVASYNTTVGDYSADPQYFANPYDNEPLHAPQDGTAGGNGLFLYGAGGFPTNTSNSTNYWVDVVFSPTGSFGISGSMSGYGGAGATMTLSGSTSATVTADASGNYSFASLPNGVYIVTPSKVNSVFTPGSQTVVVNGASVTGVNFSVQTIPGGALAIDVTASKDSNTAAKTIATAAFSTTAANELLLAFISADAPTTGTNTTVSSIAGGSLTWVLAERSNTQRGTAEVWRAFAPTVLTNATVTATLSAANAASITVVTFKGADPTGTSGSGAIGAVNSTNSAKGAPTASLTTTRNNSWVFGVGVDWDNATARTVGPSQTMVHQYLAPIGDAYWVQRQTAVTPTSGTSVTINDTAPTTDRYNLAIVEVRSALNAVSGTITNGAGATVALSGCATATTTADASGNYSFSGVPNGTCTITPTLLGFGMSPTNWVIGVNEGNATGVNFTATAMTWTISGTVAGAGGNAATVTLSGGASATVTADASGNYSFTGLVNGAYTVTPSKTGFAYTPGGMPVTVSNASMTGVNFSTITYTVSGTISGPGGNAATVSLGGAATATVTADASGNYSFTGLVNGAYTVTPSHTGFAFTPVSQPVTVNGANVSAVNFTSSAGTTYTLSGTITGTGNSGATVQLSGAGSGSTTTDASGNYTFTGLLNGVYNVTPSKAGMTFNPGAQPATVSNANVTGVNFSIFQNCPCSLWTASTVPGTVSANDPSAIELGVRFSSDVSGYISGIRFYKGATNTGTHIGNLWSNTGTNLATATFSNETASGWQQVTFPTPVAIAANTTYVASYYTPTGGYSYDQNYFTSAFNNMPLHGMQDGASGSNGLYLYSGASAFPTNTFLSSNYYVDVVFATVQTFSISGTVSGLGGNGATVNLTGASTATATADASGNYTFTGLANGSYSVTPSNTGFTFTPASQPATVNGTNVAALNFSTATYSIAGTISGAGGSGATVNLTGTSTATVTADASGNYTFTGLNNGSYTVTASKTGFTFAPASQPATVNNANMSGLNFSTAASTISGTISGPGGNAATVNLTGASTATVTADASGNYTFTSLANGSYTVTPSKTGFTFTPASQPATINNANVTALNFSTVTYTVSGTISGTGGNAATVNLTGTSTAAVTADASGNYTFSGLVNGSYTVTPSKSGFTFTPTNAPVTVNSANVTAVNFSSAVATTYSISGTISGPGGNAATVNLTGTSTATVTADASGNYTFTGLNNGSYTVTPSKTGFTFSPVSQPATINNANVTALNFSTVTYSIAGTISGLGGNAATVNLTGTSTATVTADASGNYTFTGLVNGSYTVTPSKTGFTFTPASQPATVSNANVTALNFSTVTYSIAGTISAPGGNAATVNLTGTSTATVTADASGNYTFTGLVNGSYTVTPSKTGFTYTPASQPATINGANVTALNFSTVTYSISGTISGAGGNAATVNLTGTSTATVTADASGNYTFNGLVNGAYTVTPSKAGFSFTPTSQPATISNASVTALNFSSAAATTFSISGTITGTGGNAATVTLSGAAAATVTADASGNYSFINLANGAYTVTPSKAGFLFTPANAAVTVNGANMAANFSAVSQLAIDKTASTDKSTAATTIVSPAFTTSSTNELLLAFISTDANSSGITVSGVTGGSLTWAMVKRTNTQLGTSEIWRAFAPAVVTNATVTATLSQSVAASITVVTMTGVDTTGTSGSGAIGATNGTNAASGAPTASVTTTRNNSWVFGVGNDYDNATSRTVGANQTMVHQYLATIGDTYWVQRQTAVTPASGTVVTINDTAPTADRYNLSVCEVLPAQ